jgi:hypothetical protein
MGIERKQKIPWLEAVASWYDHVYLPMVKIIRDHTILKDFPRRTEADLYLWIMNHHYFLNEHHLVGLDDAAMDFAANYSQRIDKKFLRGLRRAVADFLGGESLLPVEGTMTSEPHHADEEHNESE